MSLPVVGRTIFTGWLLLAVSQFAGAAPDRVPWLTDLATAKQTAANRNLPILLHFTADSCPPCRRLEKNVFSRAEFGYAVGQSFVPVKINVAHQPQIAQMYNVTSWPTDIVVSPAGQVMHQMVSPQDGAQYLQALRQVAWHYQHQTNHSAVVATPAGRNFQSALTEHRHGTTPYMAALDRGMASTAGNPSIPSQAVAGYRPPATGATQPFAAQAQPSLAVPGPVGNGPRHGGSMSATVATAAAPGVPATAGYTPVPIDNPYFQAANAAAAVPPTASQVSMTQPVAPAQPPPAASVPLEKHVQTSYQATAPSNQLTHPGTPAPTPNVAASNSMAMDGYCPVTVMDENRWMLGNARWGAQHRGKIYLFQHEVAQQRFLADPERYAPVLAGFDPVAMADFGKFSVGKREHGVRFNERMYLFEDEDSLQRFSQSPDEYVARVQATLQAIATGH